MSKNLITKACACHLRPALKAVLKELAWFGDDEGNNIFPSVRTLVDRTSLTRKGVQKLLRELERIGAIDTLGSRLGGRGRSTLYRINVGWVEQHGERANTVHPFSSKKDGGKSENREPQGQERANESAEKSERGSPEKKEHEYEKKQQQSPPKTEPRKAVSYEQQRFHQETRKQAGRMRMPATGPINPEARREELRAQAQSLQSRKLA